MDDDIKKKIIDYFENQRLMGDTLFIPEVRELFAGLNRDNDNEVVDKKEKAEPKTVIKKKKTATVVSEKEEIFKLDDSWKEADDLDTLYNRIHNCRQCVLGKTRTKFVFGTGNPQADIMIIGEAPGKDEDEQGKPFVGRAGKLLTKIIESIDLKREDVYIANICKCRPPGNRAPYSEEVAACLPFLLRQIEIIKPAFILALGATAVGSLTGTKPIMAQARGKLTDFHGVPMLITYHPAALLYNPNLKRAVWDDMKLLKKLYLEYLDKKNV